MKELLDEADALFCIRVSLFGSLRQNTPHQRDRDFSNDDSNNEEVDITAAELPVGSVHCEEITFFGFGESWQNASGEVCEGQDAVQKEVLEASVTAFVGAMIAIVSSG